MPFTKAIDVSHWQGDIDWQAVKNSGVEIAIIKVTGGDAGLYVDSKVGVNYANARNVGLAYGTYHFAGGGDPITEADYFCRTVSPLDEGQVLLLDWEVNVPDPVGWCWQFVSHVHDRLGVWPMIYMSGSRVPAFYGSDVLKNCGLWVAWYDRDPEKDLPLKTVYVMHQYTSNGSVPGISGRVDLDAFYGSVEQFNKYGYHTPVPVPVPDPVPVPTPEPEPNPAPVPDPTPVPNPEPAPTPTPEPEPVPVPSPSPEKPADWRALIIAVGLAVAGLVAAVVKWLHN